MWTSADFDQFYAVPDPWQASKSSFRDRLFRRIIVKFVAGRSVLELGCGEGHLTQEVFGSATSVTGIDISDVAITRASSRRLRNARFHTLDLREASLVGFDVIAAIECLYYLAPEDQEAFFFKASREHKGKILILSGPIIGEDTHRRYFTHDALTDTFERHGISVLEFHNLNFYRRGAWNLIAVLARLPFSSEILNLLPDHMVYQRCYVLRA